MMPVSLVRTSDVLAKPEPFTSPLTDYLRLLILLIPTIAAILARPGFITQDGPAHVYNAEILRQTLTPFHGAQAFPLTAFDTRLEPLPNWAGHATLIGLLSVLPARAADQAMIVLTLIGPAALCIWLARTVRGGSLPWPMVILCALLGLNWLWLLGFYSFLLGSMAFLLTVGCWWRLRDQPGPRLGLLVGLLMIVGYFCHPISLTLTVLALGVLCLSSTGKGWLTRALWTVIGFTPLIPLGLTYRRLMGAGGELAPTWAGFSKGFGLASVAERLLWIEPITLGRRTALPFASSESRLNGLAAPALWLGLGLLFYCWKRQCRSPRPWFLASAALLGLAFLAPDSMGPTHGHYLTQRVVWLGLMLLVPALATVGGNGGPSPRSLRLPTACLGIALVVQTAFVWDYARESNRLFDAYTKALPAVGQKQRLAGLFLDLRGRFRANPLVHLDCWLGVGTQNVVWSNYEAAYYYFPVRVRPGPDTPPIREFEAISIMDAPKDAPERLARWTTLLDTYHPAIDRLVLWGHNPELERATEKEYTRTLNGTFLQVWARRNPHKNGDEP